MEGTIPIFSWLRAWIYESKILNLLFNSAYYQLYGSGQVAPPLWASVSSSDKWSSNCFDKHGHASVRLAGRQDLEHLREPAPNLLRTHEADPTITSIFQDRKLRPRAGVRALDQDMGQAHGGMGVPALSTSQGPPHPNSPPP